MTVTKEELSWGKNVKFKNGNEDVDMENFISDVLTKIEEGVNSSDDGNFEFQLSWTDSKGLNRQYLYDWMTVDRQGQFAGRAMRGNFDMMSKKLEEIGIYSRSKVVYSGESPSVVYYFSKKKFAVVEPDGHVAKKSKKERLQIVKTALSEVAGNSVNHPSHYNQGGIECIDALKECLGLDGFKGFCKGNAIKYLWRSGHKNDEIEDLKKASWYVNKLVETLDDE